MESKRFPTLRGEVELKTGFTYANCRVYSGDKTLYFEPDRVEVDDDDMGVDGKKLVWVFIGGKVVMDIEMDSHVARRFAVECSRAGVETNL